MSSSSYLYGIRVEGIPLPQTKTLWCKGNQTKTMSKSTQKIGNELFNNIFELQFGYKPLTKKSNGGLLKFKDVSDESFKTLQLMGYIPYIVNEFENNPNPSFVNAVRVKGTAKETSCGSLRTIYKRIGFIDSKNGKMIKGKNYDKFLTTKWDWFYHNGTKVTPNENEYYRLQREGRRNYLLNNNRFINLNTNSSKDVLIDYLNKESEISDYLNKKSENFSKLRKQLIQTHSPQTDLTQYGLGAESVVNELLEILNKK